MIKYFCPMHAPFSTVAEYVNRFYSDEEKANFVWVSSVREPISRAISGWHHLGIRHCDDPDEWVKRFWLKMPNDEEFFRGGEEQLKIFRTEKLDAELKQFAERYDLSPIAPVRRNTRQQNESRAKQFVPTVQFKTETVQLIQERFVWTYKTFGYRPNHPRSSHPTKPI